MKCETNQNLTVTGEFRIFIYSVVKVVDILLKNEFGLITERLILRPLEINDLDSVHEYASDIENTKYMIHLPNDSIQQTEHFLKRVVNEWNKDCPSFCEFAVILDGKHIGAVSVSMDESRQIGELGWIINRRYQNNGYATEAAKAVLSFAINELKLRKVVAHCDYRNEPSCCVMKKIGLSLERNDGIRYYKNNDDDIKVFMYSMTIK